MPTSAEKITSHHNFIDGGWVPSVSGQTVRESESRQHRRSDRRCSRNRPRRTWRRRSTRRAGLRALAPRAGAAARGAPVSRGATHRGPQGGARPRHDARDGEGAGRDARRRPGSHRHDLLHGRRGAAAVRADRAVRAARQVCDVGAAAARASARDHHAVEFPDGDSVVEDHPGARLRQHGRVQAGHADAAFGAELRQDSRGGRRPARRRQPGDRRRRRGRQRDARQRRRARRVVHRIDRRRAHGVRTGGAVVQEGPPRDGRQERHHGDGRCESRPRRRRLPVGRVRHDRPALHGREPRRRPREGVRPFLDRFVARARALRVGDGLDPGIADGTVGQ